MWIRVVWIWPIDSFFVIRGLIVEHDYLLWHCERTSSLNIVHSSWRKYNTIDSHKHQFLHLYNNIHLNIHFDRKSIRHIYIHAFKYYNTIGGREIFLLLYTDYICVTVISLNESWNDIKTFWMILIQKNNLSENGMERWIKKLLFIE